MPLTYEATTGGISQCQHIKPFTNLFLDWKENWAEIETETATASAPATENKRTKSWSIYCLLFLKLKFECTLLYCTVLYCMSAITCAFGGN